jgi:hypothetical protein
VPLLPPQDMAPRLLGGSMGRVHDVLQTRLPSLAAVRAIADHYYPIGMYHLLLGGTLRTLPQQDRPQAQQGSGRDVQTSWGGIACRGRVGSQAYTQEVAAQLEISGLWRAAMLAAGDAGLLRDHSMQLYKVRLCQHLEAVAAAAGGRAALTAAAAPVSQAGSPGGGAQQQQQLELNSSSGGNSGHNGSRRSGSVSGWGGNRRSPSLEHKAALFGQTAGGAGEEAGDAVQAEGGSEQGGTGQAGEGAAVALAGGDGSGGWEAAVLSTADRALAAANRWLGSWAQDPQA